MSIVKKCISKSKSRNTSKDSNVNQLKTTKVYGVTLVLTNLVNLATRTINIKLQTMLTQNKERTEQVLT